MSFQRIKRVAHRGLQQGFTLVELAIVLVIAGVILVAVLKGTDSVNKAKVERMVSDLRGLQSTIMEFQKRVGRLPGDCSNNGLIGFNTMPVTAKMVGVAANATLTPDNTVANRVPTWVNTTDSPVQICGDTLSSEVNPSLMWNELRKAGVVDSQRLPFELARHTMDDLYVVGNIQDATTPSNTTNAIIVYGIPVWMAEAIDAEVDGVAHFYDVAGTATTGPANSGRVRLWSSGVSGGTGGATPALPTYAAATTATATYGVNRDTLVSISYQFDARKLPN